MTNLNTSMFTQRMKGQVNVRLTDSAKLLVKAEEIRLATLEAMAKTGMKYVGSSMSVVDILVALYYGRLLSGEVLAYERDDRLVYSKGHAPVPLYAILADLGFFDQAELGFIGKENALLTSRPSVKVPGVFAPVNGVGGGLSMGVGMALTQRLERNNGRTFVVMGDGELQCGEVWEAALFAGHHRLDNLVAVIDNNRIQSGSLLAGVLDVGSIQDKFEAFGWKVILVGDGHDYDKLLGALERGLMEKRRPICLWTRTISGKGIPFAEAKEDYHASGLSEGELQELRK